MYLYSLRINIINNFHLYNLRGEIFTRFLRVGFGNGSECDVLEETQRKIVGEKKAHLEQDGQ